MRGTSRHYVYTYPSKKALRAIKTKVKAMCMQNVNETLADLARRLNPVLRGWTAYFRAGVSSATFEHLRSYVWSRVMR
ncbi:group II intron maturase-specific domain-containing protein [Frankia canadensis]|uniref:group II intron maturase-specific domain-containing protein n=1 Tax=Frankia canadensis TaxID=1836972 RepID=UPI001FAFCB09|nr:group II intron maturase-specific domain-containing protein [Frankia canadensis]